MRSHSALFVAFVTVAVTPILSAPTPVQASRDVQHNGFNGAGPPGPGMMEMHPMEMAGYHPNPGMPGSHQFDGEDNRMMFLPKRSMHTFDQLLKTRDIANQPKTLRTSAPSKTYSRRAFNLGGVSKAFSFFRDIMDEGVAVDAVSSDTKHLVPPPVTGQSHPTSTPPVTVQPYAPSTSAPYWSGGDTPPYVVQH